MYLQDYISMPKLGGNTNCSGQQTDHLSIHIPDVAFQAIPSEAKRDYPE